MREPVIAAIFDLDGTLYSGHITRGIALHHRTHRVNRLAFYFYMVTHMSLLPPLRLGLLSEAKARGLWASNLGWTVRGWTPEDATKAFTWIAEEYVKPLVYPDILARLREHQAAGHRTILVSGTFSPLLAEIGRVLGIEETVGTPLILSAGRYTGTTESPACQGVGKMLRLEMHLADIDSVLWSESYAYADSCADLPLLERVGHPVAVYPDSQLADYAQRAEYEIMWLDHAGLG